jgi:hypothetical protein
MRWTILRIKQKQKDKGDRISAAIEIEINRLVSSLKKMTKCSQRPNTIADDLRGRQHRHRQDRAGNTPHPEPEDERDDDEDGIEGD